MSTQLQLRRGTAAEHNTFTGADGEVTVNTTDHSIHVHDGSTVGGFELAKKSDVKDPSITTIQTREPTGHYSIQEGDQYVRISHAGGTVIIDVPDDATLDLAIGTQITFIWVAGQVAYFNPLSGVTLNYTDTPNFRKINSACTLIKVAANTWDLIGDLQVS